MPQTSLFVVLALIGAFVPLSHQITCVVRYKDEPATYVESEYCLMMTGDLMNLDFKNSDGNVDDGLDKVYAQVLATNRKYPANYNVRVMCFTEEYVIGGHRDISVRCVCFTDLCNDKTSVVEALRFA